MQMDGIDCIIKLVLALDKMHFHRPQAITNYKSSAKTHINRTRMHHLHPRSNFFPIYLPVEKSCILCRRFGLKLMHVQP